MYDSKLVIIFDIFFFCALDGLIENCAVCNNVINHIYNIYNKIHNNFL
jgi:hypothetical protein